MESPLNASASTAGNLLSNYSFEIPPYQREYSWGQDQVREFWTDLSQSLYAESYFLGLVILTNESEDEDAQDSKKRRKQVVDGQQRLITLTLLAKAIHQEAEKRGRKALADKIQMDFLRTIDYETDGSNPRIVLTDPDDNRTFQQILETGNAPIKVKGESVSQNLVESYRFLQKSLYEDLSVDPFKRLGQWTEFLRERLYFAVFLHPTAASAYTVFEVVNTRGRELTTADLLKNYVLSQIPGPDKESVYGRWRNIAKNFANDGAGSNFVQFIRHVVTVRSGHILPKDLYSFIAQKNRGTSRRPPAPLELLESLEAALPLYLQMIDPTLPGPAGPSQLLTFQALNSLGVMTVRPILLAASGLDDEPAIYDYVLRLVVRRIVVGNLGTGNVERKFSDAAKNLKEFRRVEVLRRDLSDLDPRPDDFFEQLRKRSFNKNTLTFLRRSIVQRSRTPDQEGTLHFIWPKVAGAWPGIVDDATTWGTTIGNTVLAATSQRPMEATESWNGFRESMLKLLVSGELHADLEGYPEWTLQAIEEMGRNIADIGMQIWF